MKALFSNTYVKAGLVVFGILFILFVVFELQGNKKKNWKKNFERQEKIPFGTYVLYDLLEDMFDAEQIESVDANVFDHLVYTFHDHATYIFINDEIPMDKAEVTELVDFVHQGNEVLMATESFPSDLERELDFIVNKSVLDQRDSVTIQFTSQAFAHKTYTYEASDLGYFKDFNHNTTQVLARTTEGDPCLVRINREQGAFILCTSPLLLTNYFLLREDDHTFASGTLSYLSADHKVFWDEYYKTENLRKRYRSNQSGRKSGGALDYIFSQEALKWAFWLVICSVFIYTIFEAKRTQRIIPVITPKSNMTLDFTRTVGQLYYQSSDHKNIAEKKIKFLLEYIRSHYFLKTSVLSDEFIMSLAGKSGIEEPEIRFLFNRIHHIRAQSVITENELIQLSQKIDQFYQESAR